MKKYGYMAAAAILGTTAFAAHAENTEVASSNGYSLSVDFGYTQTNSDETIPFAYNSSNNGIYHADLGDGSLAGIAFRMPLGDAMGLSLRYRAKSGESLDRLLPEAFALVTESAARALGMRHPSAAGQCPARAGPVPLGGVQGSARLPHR